MADDEFSQGGRTRARYHPRYVPPVLGRHHDLLGGPAGEVTLTPADAPRAAPARRGPRGAALCGPCLDTLPPLTPFSALMRLPNLLASKWGRLSAFFFL